MKKFLLISSAIGLIAAGCNLNSASSSSTLNSQLDNATVTPVTSAILDKAIPPTYNGSDLARLRQECATQAQTGFNKFVQEEYQFDDQYGQPRDNYSLYDYHFNEKLATCLIEINGSFTTPNKITYGVVEPNTPANTILLVNIYQNNDIIMSCTTFRNPEDTFDCTDDQNNMSNGQGNKSSNNNFSYEDWDSILNQYMSQ